MAIDDSGFGITPEMIEYIMKSHAWESFDQFEERMKFEAAEAKLLKTEIYKILIEIDLDE